MRIRRGAIIAASLYFAVAVGAPASAASDAAPVVVHATVNGRDVDSSSAARPVRLHPSTPAVIHMTVINSGPAAITVQQVQLSGRVVGLTFFSFNTSVDLSVAAHSQASLGYSLDLTGLDGQATGLIGGSFAIFDENGHRLARESMVTDVRGSIYSVYGFFGLAIVLLTLLALLDVALAIARHQLPANRWRRATRALTPGIGIGLVLVFTLSAVRVWVPSTNRWLEVAAGFAVVFFVLGYLTPTPVTADDDVPDEDEDEEADESCVTGPIPAVPAATQPPSPVPAAPQLSTWPASTAESPEWDWATPTRPAAAAVAPPTLRPVTRSVPPPPGQPES